MSMEEFGDLFFVTRDLRQKVFELLRHRARHVLNPGKHPIKRFALKGREITWTKMRSECYRKK
jgi:hypothetical protein